MFNNGFWGFIRNFQAAILFFRLIASKIFIDNWNITDFIIFKV